MMRPRRRRDLASVDRGEAPRDLDIIDQARLFAGGAISCGHLSGHLFPAATARASPANEESGLFLTSLA
jgi:hypothetical protein